MSVSSNGALAYPPAAAPSPTKAAEEIVDFFDTVDDWAEKYQHLIDIGSKLPPMAEVLKTEPNRVQRCQSTVFMHARTRPGTKDVVEFLADSDADIVRGELALLQKLYCGQRAAEILAFDIQRFMERIGLEQHLSPGRRTGLSEMIARVKHYAGEVASKE